MDSKEIKADIEFIKKNFPNPNTRMQVDLEIREELLLLREALEEYFAIRDRDFREKGDIERYEQITIQLRGYMKKEFKTDGKGTYLTKCDIYPTKHIGTQACFDCKNFKRVNINKPLYVECKALQEKEEQSTDKTEQSTEED